MIADDQQLGIVSRQLQELKAWRDRVLLEPVEDPLQMRVEVAGIEKMMTRLQEEIAAYESVRARRAPLGATAQGRNGFQSKATAARVAKPKKTRRS